MTSMQSMASENANKKKLSDAIIEEADEEESKSNIDNKDIGE